MKPMLKPEFKYVCGFMFSPCLSRVLLLRKTRPDWQARKLNGLGGKIELNEEAITAMVREFKEESGLVTAPGDWSAYCNLFCESTNAWIQFYVAVGQIDKAERMTDEQPNVASLQMVQMESGYLVDNVAWLIPLAIAHLKTKMVAAVIQP